MILFRCENAMGTGIKNFEKEKVISTQVLIGG
jgi:hypothetical protein